MDGVLDRQRFQYYISQDETSWDLATAALLIARDEYPALVPSACLMKLNEIAQRVREDMRRRPSVPAHHILNQVLYEEEGYRGNRDNYYDPRNSFLNEVMERKLGIPISLSLIYMAVGRRAGLNVSGIGLPGHFIAGLAAGGQTLLVDPFDKGRVMTETECRAQVAELFEGRVEFNAGHLLPVTPRVFLTRMLYNLKHVYMQSKQTAKTLSIVDKIVALNPRHAVEIRDRGLLWYQLRQFRASFVDLTRYLQIEPEADDYGDIRKLAEVAHQRLHDDGEPSDLNS
jgi:regulator of sirC expression with transglutaminase-like and TPR domain